MPRDTLRWLMLAGLFVLVAVVLQSGGCGTDSNSHRPNAAQNATPAVQSKRKLTGSELGLRIPPVSGEAVVADRGRLQLIGGLDSAGVSSAAVSELDTATGRLRQDGSLSQPLHDAAAGRVGGTTLVFGGGSSTTVDTVQRLTPGGTATNVGHLPSPASDLSALTIGGQAYVLGGFDGQTTVASVLNTGNGTQLRDVATLPVPVRYTAAAPLGGSIYAFGGELADGTDSDVIQRIDPASGKARVVGHLPQPLAHSSAIELGGRIFLLGGRESGAPSNRILRFDAGSSRVILAGTLPIAVMNAAAAVTGDAGYLVGGLGAAGTTLPTVIRVR